MRDKALRVWRVQSPEIRALRFGTNSVGLQVLTGLRATKDSETRCGV